MTTLPSRTARSACPSCVCMSCYCCCIIPCSIQHVELATSSSSSSTGQVHLDPPTESDVLATDGSHMVTKSSRTAALSASRRLPMQESKALGDLSVLIVDDSALNRKMLARTLKQHRVGATFAHASDGRELLAMLGVPHDSKGGSAAADDGDDVLDFSTDATVQNTAAAAAAAVAASNRDSLYDVILLDDNMTYMNGSVAVRAMRRHGYAGLIVGVTGSALEEDMSAFCLAGVDHALPKPFVVKDFVEIVQAHF